jgi:hypothetical protein
MRKRGMTCPFHPVLLLILQTRTRIRLCVCVNTRAEEEEEERYKIVCRRLVSTVPHLPLTYCYHQQQLPFIK